METIIVTAALIRENNNIFIAQRKTGSHLALKWEFPGGKIEAGESPEECLKREIKEELDLDISVGRIFEVVSHYYENKHLLLLCYECFINGGQVSAIDCNDFRWVQKGQLNDMDFAEADLRIVERLLEEKNE